MIFFVHLPIKFRNFSLNICFFRVNHYLRDKRYLAHRDAGRGPETDRAQNRYWREHQDLQDFDIFFSFNAAGSQVCEESTIKR